MPPSEVRSPTIEGVCPGSCQPRLHNDETFLQARAATRLQISDEESGLRSPAGPFRACSAVIVRSRVDRFRWYAPQKPPSKSLEFLEKTAMTCRDLLTIWKSPSQDRAFLGKRFLSLEMKFQTPATSRVASPFLASAGGPGCARRSLRPASRLNPESVTRRWLASRTCHWNSFAHNLTLG